MQEVILSTGHDDHPMSGLPSIENLERTVSRARQQILQKEPKDLDFEVS